MNSFRDMSGSDVIRIVQIGNRAADLQNSIVSARRQSQSGHGAFQHRFTLRINATGFANQTRRHRGVCENSLAGKSLALSLASIDYSLPDRF